MILTYKHIVLTKLGCLPFPSNPCFFRFPCFFCFPISLAFLGVFPLLSKVFRGSAKRKTLVFFGVSLAFPKTQGLEGQGMSSNLYGTDRISLRKMPLKPHGRPFKLQKWAFRAFKTRSVRGWDLEGSKLLGGFSRQKIEEVPSIRVLPYS